MDQATFMHRLQQATDAGRAFAQRFVSRPLPPAARYVVRLNQSHDEDLRLREQVFPDEADPAAPLTAAEVVALLWRDRCVPEWIDISVEAADDQCTFFRLLCCGRFTADESLLYYPESGLSPFGCKSPALPHPWTEEEGKMDLPRRIP